MGVKMQLPCLQGLETEHHVDILVTGTPSWLLTFNFVVIEVEVLQVCMNSGKVCELIVRQLKI